MAVITGCTAQGLIAIKAILMCRVAPSATAAVVMGSRKKRWHAIHSVPAPPSSAARASAGIAAMGVRPSTATLNSRMTVPVGLPQRLEKLVEATRHERGRGQSSVDGSRVLQAACGDERDRQRVRRNDTRQPQPCNRRERRCGCRLGPNTLGSRQLHDPLYQLIVGNGDRMAIAA